MAVLIEKASVTKNNEKCFNTYQTWRNVDWTTAFVTTCSILFTAFVTPYLAIDLGSFLTSDKSKIFLAMSDEGDYRPLQTPKQKGAHPCRVTL
jgi:hypothetical protein